MNKLDVIVKLFLDFQKEHEVYKYINTICDLWVNYTNNEYKIQWRQTFPSFSEDYLFVNIPCSMTISNNDIMYELLKETAIKLHIEHDRMNSYTYVMDGIMKERIRKIKKEMGNYK